MCVQIAVVPMLTVSPSHRSPPPQCWLVLKVSFGHQLYCLFCLLLFFMFVLISFIVVLGPIYMWFRPQVSPCPSFPHRFGYGYMYFLFFTGPLIHNIGVLIVGMQMLHWQWAVEMSMTRCVYKTYMGKCFPQRRLWESPISLLQP